MGQKWVAKIQCDSKTPAERLRFAYHAASPGLEDQSSYAQFSLEAHDCMWVFKMYPSNFTSAFQCMD